MYKNVDSFRVACIIIVVAFAKEVRNLWFFVIGNLVADWVILILNCVQNWDKRSDYRKDNILSCNNIFEFNDNTEIF